jgi:hypothetical protein
MKRKLLLQILAIVGVVFFFISCEYEFIEAPKPVPPEPGDTISFAAEVVPIFEDGCTGCHNGGIAFDLTAANAYNNIVNMNLVVPNDPEASRIWYFPEPVNGEHNAKYSNKDANTIYNWINQGALNN